MTASLLDRAHNEARGTATALPLICTTCGARFEPEPSAICLHCLGPLVPEYDARRSLPSRTRIFTAAFSRLCSL